MVIAFDPVSAERVRQMIGEYDEARIADARYGEADNSGNVAGDALVDALRECFNHPKVAALVVKVS